MAPTISTSDSPADDRPASDSSTRGDATRAALVDAGLELFGTLGYHAASSRALADAAGVNQALIGYHFGGKKGLYLAVFERIADGFEQRLGPTGARLAAGLDDAVARGDRDALVGFVVALLERAADLFAAPETGPWAMLIVREQQNPSDAFDIVWNRIMSRFAGLLSRILGALRGAAPDDPEVRVLALTLISQPLMFRVARETALRMTGWSSIGADELALIKRRIRDNVQRLLAPESTP